jgi:hypothetical protein
MLVTNAQWNEAVVVPYLKILYHHAPEDTEENYEETQSGNLDEIQTRYIRKRNLSIAGTRKDWAKVLLVPNPTFFTIHILQSKMCNSSFTVIRLHQHLLQQIRFVDSMCFGGYVTILKSSLEYTNKLHNY